MIKWVGTGEHRDASDEEAPEADDEMGEALYHKTALELLACLTEYDIGREPLAAEVMARHDPEQRELEPQKFKARCKAYARRLARIQAGHPLWQCIGRRNKHGEPLTFLNPTRSGRRAPKPTRQLFQPVAREATR